MAPSTFIISISTFIIPLTKSTAEIPEPVFLVKSKKLEEMFFALSESQISDTFTFLISESSLLSFVIKV